jgi:hypothetical protein
MADPPQQSGAAVIGLQFGRLAARTVEDFTDVFARISAAGMRGPHVCRSVDDVLVALQAEGVPMRPVVLL